MLRQPVTHQDREEENETQTAASGATGLPATLSLIGGPFAHLRDQGGGDLTRDVLLE
jgi:hypothetical protein